MKTNLDGSVKPKESVYFEPGITPPPPAMKNWPIVWNRVDEVTEPAQSISRITGSKEIMFIRPTTDMKEENSTNRRLSPPGSTLIRYQSC